MKAYGRYIWVDPIKREEKTNSGIVLTVGEETGKYFAGRGIVTAVPVGVEGIYPGDTLIFKKHNEHVIKSDDLCSSSDEEQWVVNLDAVLGVEEAKSGKKSK